MYNPIKAAQIIAYFAMKSGTRSIPVLKVVKLVYLSDRASIAKWGFPILDEDRYSMPLGPVNSSTYSYISGEHRQKCGWSRYLMDRAEHEVSAINSLSIDDLDELSDADIECLEQVWAEFGAMGKYSLRDWTHKSENIPEWEDPNGSSSLIPLERIMKYLGVENIDEQIEIINDYKKIDDLFASMSNAPKRTM